MSPALSGRDATCLVLSAAARVRFAGVEALTKMTGKKIWVHSLCSRLAKAILPVVVPLALATPATADWINLTGAETAPNIAEIYVLDDHVKVVLEVYIADLETFSDLVPDSWMREGGAERPPLDARLRRFSTEVLRFVTDKGETLRATSALVEPRLRKDR